MAESNLVIVEERHIERGVPESEEACAVALALQEKFPASTCVVGPLDFEIDGVLFKLPAEVIEFVSNFDASYPVQPLAFELVPQKFIKD